MIKKFKTMCNGYVQVWHLDRMVDGQLIIVAYETDELSEWWARPLGDGRFEVLIPDDPTDIWSTMEGVDEHLAAAWNALSPSRPTDCTTVDAQGDSRTWRPPDTYILSDAQGPFGHTLVRRTKDSYEWSALNWRPVVDEKEALDKVWAELVRDD